MSSQSSKFKFLTPLFGNIDTEDDVIIYRSVISISYHTLPHVVDVDPAILRFMSTGLIKQITRFNRAILNEVIPCLWTISNILQG